jgi:hypothetical protein
MPQDMSSNIDPNADNSRRLSIILMPTGSGSLTGSTHPKPILLDGLSSLHAASALNVLLLEPF